MLISSFERQIRWRLWLRCRWQIEVLDSCLWLWWMLPLVLWRLLSIRRMWPLSSRTTRGIDVNSMRYNTIRRDSSAKSDRPVRHCHWCRVTTCIGWWQRKACIVRFVVLRCLDPSTIVVGALAVSEGNADAEGRVDVDAKLDSQGKAFDCPGSPPHALALHHMAQLSFSC